VTDAQIAAIAIEQGAVICTNDSDFRRFPEAKILNPSAQEVSALPAAFARSMKARIFPTLRVPSGSSTARCGTSTPTGAPVLIASRTFSGVRPPAQNDRSVELLDDLLA